MRAALLGSVVAVLVGIGVVGIGVVAIGAPAVDATIASRTWTCLAGTTLVHNIGMAQNGSCWSTVEAAAAAIRSHV